MATPSQEALGNPTPLGLVTFGLSTLLLSFANAGFYPGGGSAIIGQALWVGGIVQLVAGIQEFVKGNTFGAVVFSSFGGFWITVGTLGYLPVAKFASEVSGPEAGTFMLLWGIYVFLLLLGIYKGLKALTLVVSTLALLLIVLAIFYYTGNPAIAKLAGWIGIICGGSALYLGCAITLMETNGGKKVLPFG
ncbi:MAG: acetate uptake transporter [Deltaproteobacteria bacterium]|jgi:succinate-acetate transporter protein|nr:acetate uptake transporter [Deltaproteobacteria bacterium]